MTKFKNTLLITFFTLMSNVEAFGNVRLLFRRIENGALALSAASALYCGYLWKHFPAPKETVERFYPGQDAEEREQQIKHILEKGGYQVELKNNFRDCLGCSTHDKKVILYLGLLDRKIIDNGSLDICKGSHSIIMNIDHLKAAIGHEKEHVVKLSEDVDNWVFAFPHQKNKIFKQMELRCDRNAPYHVCGKDADPEELAQVAENLIHYLSNLPSSIDDYEPSFIRGMTDLEEIKKAFEQREYPSLKKRILQLENFAYDQRLKKRRTKEQTELQETEKELKETTRQKMLILNTEKLSNYTIQLIK